MKIASKHLLFLIATLFCSNNYAAAPAPVSAPRAMVTSENQLATQVGLTVLKQGGNAVDAAVAMGYALAVTDPCCGNIGGGGFMTIHLATGKNTFINFREKAPKAIKPAMFLNANGKLDQDIQHYGYIPVGIPGTVKGLNYALKSADNI